MSRWDDFLARHNRQNYTPAFNAYLEAQIEDGQLDLATRIGAWMLRTSWGRVSDSCISAEGIIQTQTDCARTLSLFDGNGKPDRRKVNPVFRQFEQLGYIEFRGQEIFLKDDPRGTFAPSSPPEDPLRTPGEEEANKFGYFLEHVWGAKHPAKFNELKDLERRHKEIRTEILSEFKAFRQMSERDRQARPPEGPQGSDSRGERVRQSREQGPTIAVVSINENGKRKTSSSGTLRETLKELGIQADDSALRKLVNDCRKERADCTEDEIAFFVRERASRINERTTNPVGFLIDAVPKCFAGELILEHREREKRRAAEITHQEAKRSADYEELLREQRAILNSDEYSDEERRMAAKILGVTFTQRKQAQTVGRA